VHTCSLAALGGQLATLRRARKHGCEWDGLTIDAARRGGCVEIIRYVSDHRCPVEYVNESDNDSDSDNEKENEEVEHEDEQEGVEDEVESGDEDEEEGEDDEEDDAGGVAAGV